MPGSNPILCVDFDGVIHSYTSGWVDVATISDPPVPGALRWLAEAARVFAVKIYSSRSQSQAGRSAMRQWLEQWALDPVLGVPPDHENASLAVIEFAHEKPAAFLTIDDRAIQFTGDWSLLDPEKLRLFKPWNQR
jgi:hypothetical protein